jgi:hypothetical protein
MVFSTLPPWNRLKNGFFKAAALEPAEQRGTNWPVAQEGSSTISHSRRVEAAAQVKSRFSPGRGRQPRQNHLSRQVEGDSPGQITVLGSRATAPAKSPSVKEHDRDVIVGRMPVWKIRGSPWMAQVLL